MNMELLPHRGTWLVEVITVDGFIIIYGPTDAREAFATHEEARDAADAMSRHGIIEFAAKRKRVKLARAIRNEEL
jgi:hypothetical protein